MKKIFVFLLLTSVLFVSCKPKEKPETPAKAVRFTTSSVAVNTKTAYSGTVQDGVEAILWDNGDEFTVWCNEASVEGSTQKFADYRVGTDLGSVTSVTPAKEGVELLWGKGAHQFYALYPAGKLYGNTISATIPEFQRTIEVETDGFFFRPNLAEYGCMVAVAAADPSESSVDLRFNPLFTTLEFIVSADEESEVTVTAFKLSVAGGSKLVISGDFQATLSPDADPVFNWDYSTSTGEIRASLGEHRSIRLSKGQKLDISVLALPRALSHLVATFVVDGKDVEIPLVDEKGEYLSFPACEKARIYAVGALKPTPKPVGFTVNISGHNVTDYTINVK